MIIPFSKITTGQEEIDAVSRVIASGWLAAGPETEAFEREFAEYVGVRYAIFTNSCTSALKMSYNILKELGFQGVYYPLNTFVATYSAASELGLAICPKGGYDGDIWRTTPSYLVKDAESSLKTGTTASAASSARQNATGHQERESGSPRRPSSRQEKEGAEALNSKAEQEIPIPRNLDTGEPTNGSRETMERPLSAMSVKELREWAGRIRTTSISSNVIHGRDYALSATMNTTGLRMAVTNVHYGSVRDDSPCLVEDSAHRIEKDDPLAGLIRCYSFYATKNMTTGSGGMFVTDNKEIYERARLYWRDGLTTSTHDRLNGVQGYGIGALVSGYDGNDMAAAMGRVQLRALPQLTARRNHVRDAYNAALGQDWQGNHLYPYFVSDEPEAYRMIGFMRTRGISCGHHYPGTGWNGVSLPIYPLLTDGEIKYIVESVRRYAQGL